MSCFSCIRPRSSSPASEPVVSMTTQGLPSFQNVLQYSYKELKTATEGFRSSNKIGVGGFGSVYKGRLLGGNIVAIKVLSAESTQGEREFLAEISSMSNIKHENLLMLRGCCVDGPNRALIFDYMENNSLAQTLLGKEHDGTKFSWNVRCSISLGIARGLAYLHEEIKPHIVHRDIKASNVLLDWDLTPKISDFGLAKLFPDNITHISTRVSGTIGYLAPEYAISGQLTRKSDIYSFGVLLLEIISRRYVMDFDLELEKQYLVAQAWELYKANKLLQMVDPILEGQFPDEEGLRFLKVALLCVQETPRLRPKMSIALKMLSNELDTNEIEILKPGLMTDFMSMKIGQKRTFNFTGLKTSTSASSSDIVSEGSGKI
ncbi:putative serine/threonine-protein kinase isoform X2 [Tasmannia lanceolata]|uniref:putative serine/threonine-protein kinase isoform X2 n=1 Tax=Tasmannia lanceolata TaxID=3420 RepID=UPI0040628668